MDHPWTGSFLTLYNTDWAQAPIQSTLDTAMVYFLFALALMFFIMYERVVVAIASSLSLLRSDIRIREVFRDKYKTGSISVVLILSIPFLTLVFTSTNISNYNYWRTLAILLSFFAGRYLLMKIVAWLVGKDMELKNVHRLSQAIFLLISVFALLVPVLLKIIPTIPKGVVISYFIAVFSVFLIFYFAKERGIFLNAGFSHFFWILYLCTLEILPICVALNAIAF